MYRGTSRSLPIRTGRTVLDQSTPDTMEQNYTHVEEIRQQIADMTTNTIEVVKKLCDILGDGHDLDHMPYMVHILPNNPGPFNKDNAISRLQALHMSNMARLNTLTTKLIGLGQRLVSDAFEAYPNYEGYAGAGPSGGSSHPSNNPSRTSSQFGAAPSGNSSQFGAGPSGSVSRYGGAGTWGSSSQNPPGSSSRYPEW